MKSRAIFGISGFVLTIAITIPVLFFLSRGSVGASQYLAIVTAVLALVLWTIPYATLVDPWLRRCVGALFRVTIAWSGTSKSMSWTPAAETGCLAGFIIGLLGYFFLILWFVPFALAIGLILWLRH
jgi:uncharacterized membrane protein